jgi:hypothetical protein
MILDFIALFVLTLILAIVLSYVKFKSKKVNLLFICFVAAAWTLSFFWAGMIVIYLFNITFIKGFLSLIGFTLF